VIQAPLESAPNSRLPEIASWMMVAGLVRHGVNNGEVVVVRRVSNEVHRHRKHL
jgi:hypothetical protein